MLPRDELRQSLLEAAKKVELLCQGFGYRPATDLRRLVTEVVQKADESRSITKPVVRLSFDNPYVVWAQHYDNLRDQFKQKYVDIIKKYAIPAIKRYFDTHPRVDLAVFEPLINIKIVGSVEASNKVMGDFMQNVKVGQTIIVKADSPSRPKDTSGSAWMYHMLKRNTWKIAYRTAKFLKMPHEEIAKRFERDNVPDAQDFIANKPMEAFTTFMKTSPRRDVKPVSFVEPFIIAVAILSGHDMAAIIFEKYFMKRADVKEALERSDAYQKSEESLLQDQFDSMTDELKKVFGKDFSGQVVTVKPGTVPPIPYEFSVYTVDEKVPYRLKYDGVWTFDAVYGHKKFDKISEVVKFVQDDIAAIKKKKAAQRKA